MGLAGKPVEDLQDLLVTPRKPSNVAVLRFTLDSTIMIELKPYLVVGFHLARTNGIKLSISLSQADFNSRKKNAPHSTQDAGPANFRTYAYFPGRVGGKEIRTASPT